MRVILSKGRLTLDPAVPPISAGPQIAGAALVEVSHTTLPQTRAGLA